MEQVILEEEEEAQGQEQQTSGQNQQQCSDASCSHRGGCQADHTAERKVHSLSTHLKLVACEQARVEAALLFSEGQCMCFFIKRSLLTRFGSLLLTSTTITSLFYFSFRWGSIISTSPTLTHI